MQSKYILAIDQGTTGSKALLLDTEGTVIASHIVDFPQIFPKLDWVEHQPHDILKSVFEAIQETLKKAPNYPQNAKQIICIGLTNQRETTVIWDSTTGEPLYNAIVWQCKRTYDFCEKLKQENLDTLFRRKTGLLLDPYFSGTKMKWLLETLKPQNDQNIMLGTIDSFLLYHLTGKKSHLTEPSNASRTLLCNLQGQWDSELCQILKIPEHMLPTIKDSNAHFGVTSNLGFLPDGIPITGILGDQQAALFGQTCYQKNDAKCTYGTGCFMMLNTGDQPVISQHGMLTTIAWRIQNKITYALEGSAFIAGAAVQWLRDGLGIIQKSEEIETLANSVKSSEEVCFVPALAGLGSPYWEPQAKGIISGITRATHKGHLALATLEGIAMQNFDIFSAMTKDTQEPIHLLSVDGGAAKNQLLLQIQANVLQCPILRPAILDTTAMGAAMMAGLGANIWSSLENLNKVKKINLRVKPLENPIALKEKWRKNIQKLIDK